MEGLNDVLANVYVLPSDFEDEKPSKCRQVEDKNRVEVDADDAGPSLLESADGIFSLINQGSKVHLVDPVRSSRVTRSLAVTD